MSHKGYCSSEQSMALNLFEAVEEQCLHDVLKLLESGIVDPNVIIPGKDISSFHLVIGCECSHFAEEATHAILKHNGNPNIQNEEGLTPVHIAAAWGRTRLLMLLLSNGGDPWLRDKEKGFTPLHFALKEKHWETALVLQRYQLKDRHSRRSRDFGPPRYNLSLEMVVVDAGEVQAEYATVPQDNVSLIPTATEKNLGNYKSKCKWNIEPLETQEYVREWCHKEFPSIPMTSTPNHHKTLNVNQIVNPQFAEASNALNSNASYRASNITISKEMTPKIVGCSSNMEPRTKNQSKAPNDVCKKLFQGIKKRFSIPKQSFYMSKEVSSKSSIFERSSGYLMRKSFTKSEKLRNLTQDQRVTAFENRIENSLVIKSQSKKPNLTADSNGACHDTDIEQNVIGGNKTSLCTSSLDEVDAVPLNDSIDTSVEWIASQSCFPEEQSPETSNSLSYITCDEGPPVDVPQVEDNVCVFPSSLPVLQDDPHEPPQRPPRRKELKAVANYGSKTAPSNSKLTTSFGTIILEKYRYTDEEAGVVLIEELFLNNPSDVPSPSDSESVVSVPLTNRTDAQSAISDVSSVPSSFCYDAISLRKELVSLGEVVGPITSTTKTVYLKRLYRLKKNNFKRHPQLTNAPVYPSELDRLIHSDQWEADILTYVKHEVLMSAPFEKPDPKRKWREGVAKSSFNYLLLDPRCTLNLPANITAYDLRSWQQFISAVFYIGKGKRSRPYAHLYEAAHRWHKGEKNTNSSPKIQRIMDIWAEGNGVVCLHVFQNIIPVEAFTREAAMIDAIGINNLVNIKLGEYYGPASMWRTHQKKQLGIYLLYRAMRVFLCEGERQLRPSDIE